MIFFEVSSTVIINPGEVDIKIISCSKNLQRDIVLELVHDIRFLESNFPIFLNETEYFSKFLKLN